MASGFRSPDRVSVWPAACVLLVIPLTAVIHHLFHNHNCMLNGLGEDYTPGAMKALLLNDPSLPWAIAIMMFIHHAGKRVCWLRRAVVPAFAASIPLSVWLWDIPFTGRYIHRTFHDGAACIAPGVPLSTKWIYALCLFIYVVFQAVLIRRRIS